MSGDEEFVDLRALRDALTAVRRRWKLVASVALIGGIAGIGFSFLFHPIYQSQARYIPVSQNSSASLLGDLASSLQNFGLEAANTTNPVVMFPEILRSRTILDEALGARFQDRDGDQVLLIDLVRPNSKETRRQEKAAEDLRKMVDADLDRRTGILTVRCRARDPQVASTLNDSLFGFLQNFMVATLTSQAGATREFIEAQLSWTKKELDTAEETLRLFRERNMRIGNSPQLQLEQARLERDVRSTEEAFWTLRKQFEIARVEEHRALPVLKVLDRPLSSERKVFPRRTVFALGGALTSGLITAYLVVIGAVRGRRIPGQTPHKQPGMKARLRVPAGAGSWDPT